MGRRSTRFRPGDIVVYRGRMSGPRPDPAAQDVVPSKNGETYTWNVEHYALVLDIRPDSSLLVRSESGDEVVINLQDIALRRLSLVERLFQSSRLSLLATGKETG